MAQFSIYKILLDHSVMHPSQIQIVLILTHQTRLRVCSAACSASSATGYLVERRVGGRPIVEVVSLRVGLLSAAHPVPRRRRDRRVLRGGSHGGAASVACPSGPAGGHAALRRLELGHPAREEAADSGEGANSPTSAASTAARLRRRHSASASAPAAGRRLVAAQHRRRLVVGHRLLERLALLDGFEQIAPVAAAATA